MSRGPIISSGVDLTLAANIVQARHELHQAVDFGGEPQRAAWATKWGDAALAAGENASLSSDYWDGYSPPASLESAIEVITQLEAEVGKDEPDLKACRRLASRCRHKLGDMLEAYEP
jgi:hypothetical protein